MSASNAKLDRLFSSGAPHVTVSTQFANAYARQASKTFQQACIEAGLSCYNPNFDNPLGDQGWLKTFDRSCDHSKATKGFLAQLNIGTEMKISDTQEAEWSIAKKTNIPILGAMVYDNADYSIEQARGHVKAMIEESKKQHDQGIKGELVQISDRGSYTGQRNAAGAYHGHGQVRFTGGEKYVGEFVNGKRHGYGVYSWEGYMENYAGNWENDEKSGHGTYTFEDGRKYDGNYENGKRHGYGTLTDPSGKVTQRGTFREGVFIG